MVYDLIPVFVKSVTVLSLRAFSLDDRSGLPLVKSHGQLNILTMFTITHVYITRSSSPVKGLRHCQLPVSTYNIYSVTCMYGAQQQAKPYKLRLQAGI
jgi:hypothetical protein